MRRAFLVLLLAGALPACNSLKTQTLGEAASGYTYVPIDPLPVRIEPPVECPWPCAAWANASLLDGFPDNAVRMLVEQDTVSGSVTFGPSKVGAKNQTYAVTIDFINADVVNRGVWIMKTMRRASDERPCRVPVTGPPGPEGTYRPGSEIYHVKLAPADEEHGPSEARPEAAAPAADFGMFDCAEPSAPSRPVPARPEPVFNIPVYVGVGLRACAHVTTLDGNVNLSGLGVIGAEAEAKRLRGTLVVQTLGVNGKAVATALPINSELNQTTAQNAVVAIATIKNSLHADGTTVVPRAVGLYLPFPGGRALVNALVTEFAKKPIAWRRPCPAAPKP